MSKKIIKKANKKVTKKSVAKKQVKRSLTPPVLGGNGGPEQIKKPIQPHQWVDGNGDVLIVKRITKDRISYNQFLWPAKGSEVLCSDWNPEKKCGHGLHGWPWGFGLGEGSDFNFLDDIWMILAAKPEDVVGELEDGWKCKARKVTIKFEGDFKSVIEIVKIGFHDCIFEMSKMTDSDNSNLAASGIYSKLAASGKNCISMIANYNGKIKTGEKGAFALAYFDNKTGWEILTGKVGRDGIEAGIWYEIRDAKIQPCINQNILS